ncbi:hypothetical protein ACJ5H2_05955 [Nocardioides sp. R1-1]|uniref:hypothetical protein n=1 Tax=Nocardioides sp. R1-1 TaxID=3383502 RepID=UPI0038D07A7B
MTEPSEFAQAEAALPGLEPSRPHDSAMVKAARRTITSLEAAGYLDERHAVLCQQMIELAEVVDIGRRSGKASAVAMAAAQIIATYQLMVPEASGGEGGDAWDELVADMRRSATAPRDSS